MSDELLERADGLLDDAVAGWNKTIDKLIATRAERDRYRGALEQIAILGGPLGLRSAWLARLALENASPEENPK